MKLNLKKLAGGVVLAAAIVVGGFFMFKNNHNSLSDDARPIVKIGAILPLTGNMASLGRIEQKSLQTAIIDANKNANNKYYYELLVEDSAGDTKIANNIAKKFANIDHVNALVSYTTLVGRATSLVANAQSIVHFNCSLGNSGVLAGPMDFQNFVQLDKLGAKTIDFLKSRNIKTLTIADANIGSSQEKIEIFKPMLDSAGIKYHIELFSSDERNFSSIVNKIKSYNDDAILISAFDPAISLITIELTRQKYEKLMLSTDNIRFARDIKIFEGMYNIGSVLPTDEFQKHIGIMGENPGYSNYMYDIVGILVETFEKTGDGISVPKSEDIASAMHSQKHFIGIVGNYYVRQNGAFDSAVMASIVKNGKLEPIK